MYGFVVFSFRTMSDTNSSVGIDKDSPLPLYQSLTIEPLQSQYDEINNKTNFPPSSSSSEPSNYDEIKDNHSRAHLANYDQIKEGSNQFTPTYKKETITTSNSLYASSGETLKHPTLLINQLSPIPEASVNEFKERRCRCSMDAVLCIFSFLVILLSSS